LSLETEHNLQVRSPDFLDFALQASVYKEHVGGATVMFKHHCSLPFVFFVATFPPGEHSIPAKKVLVVDPFSAFTVGINLKHHTTIFNEQNYITFGQIN
jgi:hypothetical protein